MYTVGLDEEGNTILKVGTDFTTTLTMTHAGVIQLIRLLEATLPEYKEEKDDQSNRNGYNYTHRVWNQDMNEIVRWIMTPLEVISFVFFLTMLMVGGFVVLPYYFIRYGYGECKTRK